MIVMNLKASEPLLRCTGCGATQPLQHSLTAESLDELTSDFRWTHRSCGKHFDEMLREDGAHQSRDLPSTQHGIAGTAYIP